MINVKNAIFQSNPSEVTGNSLKLALRQFSPKRKHKESKTISPTTNPVKIAGGSVLTPGGLESINFKGQ